MDVEKQQMMKSANGMQIIAHIVFVNLKKARIILIVNNNGVKKILPHQVAGIQILSVKSLVNMVSL